jgi:hypothetical protein
MLPGGIFEKKKKKRKIACLQLEAPVICRPSNEICLYELRMWEGFLGTGAIVKKEIHLLDAESYIYLVQ